MSEYCGNIAPEDWVRTSKNFTFDESELFGIKYIGSQAVGIITTTAVATAGILFEQGPTVASATATIGTNPGTAGLVDCSTSGVKTYAALARKVNAASDWEMWLIGALPADLMFSAASADFVVVADQECQDDGGYAVLCSNTVADYMSSALTFNGQSSEPHGSDSQVLHELLQVKVNLGSSGTYGTGVITLYSCDDIANTATAIMTLAKGSTAGVTSAYPTDSGIGEPIASVDTRRLVVKVTATAWTDNAADDLTIIGRSYAHGSAIRKGKMWSAY